MCFTVLCCDGKCHEVSNAFFILCKNRQLVKLKSVISLSFNSCKLYCAEMRKAIEKKEKKNVHFGNSLFCFKDDIYISMYVAGM